MKNQINISEILKDCPKGTKLYSPLCGECEFINIINDVIYVESSLNKTLCFNSLGMFFEWYEESECLLFPSKDQRDWSKFQRPFKDGDIISNGRYVAIFHKSGKPENCVSSNVIYYHCWYNDNTYDKFKAKIDFGIGIIEEYKYATEKEKQKLFQAIKDNGYHWNEKTKTLEKLIIPKFKVGDKIAKKNGISAPIEITGVGDTFYYSCTISDYAVLSIAEQDDWVLVSNKFDITNLKPFESKVMVRDSEQSIHEYDEEYSDIWRPAIWGVYVKDSLYPFGVQGGCYFRYCVPFEGNEHLLGTNNDCNEFYKTW